MNVDWGRSGYWIDPGVLDKCAQLYGLGLGRAA